MDSISGHAFGVFVLLIVLVFFRFRIEATHELISFRIGIPHSITHFLLTLISYAANREVETGDGEKRR